MTRKLLYIFGGAIILVLVVLGVWFAVQRRAAPANSNTNGNSSVLPNINTVVLNSNVANQNANTTVSNPEQEQRIAVQQLGTNFASIYGSFSTQNDFENVTSLYFYMTPALKSQQEQFVADERTKRTDASIYRGISSTARITTVESFDLAAGTATAKVTLQRVESSGTTSNSTVFYQDITLSFERIQGAWKIGRIAWGEKRDQ